MNTAPTPYRISLIYNARTPRRKVNGYTADDLAGMIAKLKKGWNL